MGSKCPYCRSKMLEHGYGKSIGWSGRMTCLNKNCELFEKGIEQ